MDNETSSLLLEDQEPLTIKDRIGYEEQCQALRRDIIILISKFEYKFALLKSKELIMSSKRLFFNEPYKYFYSYLTDSLLLAKCFIREDKFSLAEECLTQGWKVFNHYITNDNYKITKLIFEESGERELEAVHKYIDTTVDVDENVSPPSD